MFQGPQSWRDFVIRCKGCRENIPAMVETLPASWIAIRCPLCGEHGATCPRRSLTGARVLSGAHEASALGAGRVEVAVFDSDASMRVSTAFTQPGAGVI
jgi:hypothetical protein